MRVSPQLSDQMPADRSASPKSRWRRGRLVGMALVPAALVLAACSSSTPSASSTSSSTANTSASPAASVTKTANNSMYGTILVDMNGKTLYTLTNGGHAVACTGACAAAWPPLMLASGQPATNNGLPLYRFAGDQAAGDANGEGISSFGGVWHVVKVSGTGTSSSGAAGGAGTTGTTGTTNTTSGSGGYGY